MELNRVYILGDDLVGKTNIICKLCNQPFRLQTVSIKGITQTPFTINIENKDYNIIFKELSDNKEWKYNKIFESEIEEIKAVIIVFSLNDQSSIEKAKQLLNFVNSSRSAPGLSIVLVGNKADSKDVNLEREVKDFVKTLNNLPFFEISCYSDEGFNNFRNYMFNNIEYDSEETSQVMEKGNASSCQIF